MAEYRKTYRRTISRLSEPTPELVRSLSTLKAQVEWLQQEVPIVNTHSSFLPARVTACTFTPDEHFAVLGLKNGLVVLVDLETGCTEIPLEGHTDEVKALAASADSRFLASASSDRRVVVWKLKKQSIVAVQQSHRDCVLAVSFSSDNKLVVSSAKDSQVIAWDWNKDQEKRRITLNNNKAVALAISANKRLYYLACSSGSLLVWDALEDVQRGECTGHTWPITGLSVAADERFAVTSSMDHSVRVWDLRTYTLRGILDRKSDSINAVALTADNKYAIYGGHDGTICIADTKVFNSQGIIEIEAHTARVTCVSVSRGSRFILSGSHDSTYKLIRLSETPREYYLTGSEMPLHDLKFSQDWSLLVAASEDKNVYAWRVGCEEHEFILDGHTEAVTCIDISADGVLCVSGGGDGTVRVWDIREEMELQCLSGVGDRINAVMISKDQQYLLAGCLHQSIIVWEMGSFTKLHTLEDSNLFVRALCGGTNYFFSAGSDKVINMWSYSDFEIVYEFDDHKAAVTCLALSEVEDLLVSGAHDATIRLWNLTELLCIAVFDCRQKIVNKVDVTGDYVVSVSNSSVVTLWSISNKVEIGELYEKSMVYACGVSSNQGWLAFSSKAKIVLARMPFQAASSQVCWVVPYKYSYIYRSLLHNIVTKAKDAMDPMYVNYTLLPWSVNLMHILSYLNQPKQLRSILTSGGKFIRSAALETPLSIVLQQKYIVCAEILVDAFPLVILKNHPPSVEFIADQVELLNRTHMPSLSQFYKCLMPRVEHQHLPTYGVFKRKPPVIVVHPNHRVLPEKFLLVDGAAKEALTDSEIEFRQSTVTLNLALGSSDSISFFRSLRACEDVDVFSSEFIRAVLKFKWRQVRRFIWAQAVVYLVMLLVLLQYSVTDFRDAGHLTVLTLLNTLFFAYELIQLLGEPGIYFRSVKSWLDLLRIVYFYVYVVCVVAEADRDSLVVLLSILVVWFWLQLIAYIRMFGKTRYLIRMFFAIVAEMGPFFFIFLTVTIAFYFGFHVASNFEWEIDSNLFHTYSLAFGDFEMPEYSALETLFFLGGSLILPLILLNLVIAIMTYTFSRVRQQIYVVDRKVMASIILEIDCACFWGRHKGSKQFIQTCNLPTSKIKIKKRTTVQQRVQHLQESTLSLANKVEAASVALVNLGELAKKNDLRDVMNVAVEVSSAIHDFRRVVRKATEVKTATF